MIDYIVLYPLTALVVTIAGFVFAKWLQQKCGGHSLLNPAVITIAVVVLFVVSTGMEYETYMNNVGVINFLLGPVTVALAIPLYKQLHVIKSNLKAVIVAVTVACVVSGVVAWFLAFQMGAEEDIQLSIIPKSVTMPITIGIAEKVETIPSLAVFFVFTTGILGTLFAGLIFKICRLTDEKATGFSLGATCHALGVVTAFQRSEVSGTFAVLGMTLMGLLSGVVMPLAILMLLK